MNECMRACKTIVALCEEARHKGKSIIRIKKIENLANDAVLADMEAISDTTTKGKNSLWEASK